MLGHRSRVPHGTGSEFGHAHLQLASGEHLVDNHLVDVALVAHLQTTHVSNHGVGLGDFLAGIFLVGGAGVEVELGGFLGILRAEDDIPVATADVKGFLVVEFKHLVADFHATGTADIEDAHLTTGGEIGGLERVDGFQFQLFGHGHGAAHYHAVVHGIDHVYFVGGKYRLDEEVAANALGVITFCVLRMGRIANLVICFHIDWLVDCLFA